MSVTYLVSWIGRQDLEGGHQEPPTGPIVDFPRSRPGITAALLSDWPKDDVIGYVATLRRAAAAEVEVRHVRLKDPTDYLGIFHAADAILATCTRLYKRNSATSSSSQRWASARTL